MRDTHTGWYLVYTKPRHERIAEINLSRQGFHTYFPLVQQHKRTRNICQVITEPLFPRYLFVYLRSEKDDWSKIRSTRGCISLVRFGALPARLPDALIERIKQDENRLNQESSIAPAFTPGVQIQVIEGILDNYKGIVEIKNSEKRVTVLLTIAEGHTRCVNLSVNQLKIAN